MDKLMCNHPMHLYDPSKDDCQCGMVKNTGVRIVSGDTKITEGRATESPAEDIELVVDRYTSDLLTKLHAHRMMLRPNSVPGSHRYECFQAGLDFAIEVIKGTQP